MQEFKAYLIPFFTRFGLHILGSMVILVAGWFVAGRLGNLLNRGLEKKGLEPPLRLLLVRVVRLLIAVLTILMILEAFEVPITPLVAGIGVAGVGIGLATQGVLSNLVAGLVIIFTKPFRVGEYIELLGVNGQVTMVELFSTTLAHPDRSRIVIPNRRIVGEILHNYGQIRQALLTIGVSYEADLARTFSLLQSVAQSNPRVLKDPAPGVGIAKLGDSSITISLTPWVSLADFGPAQTELYQAIVERFREARIEIPVPQQDIRILEKAG